MACGRRLMPCQSARFIVCSHSRHGFALAAEPLSAPQTVAETVINAKELAMPETIDQRPPVAVGHVRLNVVDVGAAARWLEMVGLRPIVTRAELAVLELRGGTHVVVRRAEPLPQPGSGAPFDLMVDDIDAAYRDYDEKEIGRAHV